MLTNQNAVADDDVVFCHGSEGQKCVVMIPTTSLPRPIQEGGG